MNLWVRDSVSQIINSPVIHANHVHIHLNLTMGSLYRQPGPESDSGGDSDSTDGSDGGLAIFRAVSGGDGGGPPDLGGASAIVPVPGMTVGSVPTETHSATPSDTPPALPLDLDTVEVEGDANGDKNGDKTGAAKKKKKTKKMSRKTKKKESKANCSAGEKGFTRDKNKAP